MKQVPPVFLRHRVTVEPFLGANATGEVYGLAAEVKCMFVAKATMVRNPGGEEVGSSSSYIATPDHLPPLNSRVTTPLGTTRKVISVENPTWPGMSIPANTQVYLD